MQVMGRAYQQIWIMLICVLQPTSTVISTHDSLAVVLVMLDDFLSSTHLAALLPIDAEATVRTLQAQLLALW